MSDLNDQGTGGNEVDVDALISSTQEASPERAMGDESVATPAQVGKAPAQTQAQAIQELELEIASNKIKIPYNDPKLKQWAQQGYDYSQRMQAFNQQQAQFQKAVQDIQKQYGPYAQVEEYAKQNPQWWEQVKQAYDQRGQTVNSQDPMAQELMQLKNKINEIDQFKQEMVTKEITQRSQAEDKQLSTEMETIRKQFADLDFTSKDADGKTLEYKVLEFANQKGIKDYDVAFKAFNHDQLTKLASEKAKEVFVKESQANKKSGLLGKTQAPTKGISDAKDIRGKSYNDLLKEAIEEAGLSS